MKNIICVSAPSGAGKTTLCKAIRNKCPDLLWSVSYTTRKSRNNEVNGEDYNFITRSKFDFHIKNGDFAEFEKVHGEYYGTLKVNLEDSITKQKLILLDLDVNGTMAIKELYPNSSVSVFIVPPSIDHLRHRLINRGTETNRSIDKRLKRFNKEMKYKDRFDTLLINDNIDVAINNFILIIDKMIKGDI